MDQFRYCAPIVILKPQSPGAPPSPPSRPLPQVSKGKGPFTSAFSAQIIEPFLIHCITSTKSRESYPWLCHRCCLGRHDHFLKLSSCRLIRCISLRLHTQYLHLCAVSGTMAILSRSFDALRTYIGSFTWGPFVQISRSTVLGLLQRIETGQLVITDCDGSVIICGDAAGKAEVPKTQLKVEKEAFWVRVLLFADMVRWGT